jgi:hypothetical protein
MKRYLLTNVDKNPTKTPSWILENIQEIGIKNVEFCNTWTETRLLLLGVDIELELDGHSINLTGDPRN